MFFAGTTINGRYELNKLIARGGMGEVWQSKDHVLDRTIALKTVNASYLEANPKALAVLTDEAKTGARLLGHPNVVGVLDFGEFKDENSTSYFIVMEFIEGINIARWINEISPQIDDITYYNICLLISWELCRAIAFAHRKGILHRDIKPLNVFLSGYGLTKVGDFGLARFVEVVTRTHTVFNAMSPAYAAPEQWRGEKHTVETDFYQLGCTLYHIFTRQLPFEKQGLPAMMNAHLNEITVEPNRITSIIPEKLSKAIMELMSKKPEERLALWKLNDIIANEIQGKYKMTVSVHDKPKEIQDLVSDITELDEEKLAEGPYSFVFPDFSEVLAESIELILSGINEVAVTKET